jgi:hypothetical protein
MRAGLRFLLRLVAVLLVAGAAYLVIFQPKATVASGSLIIKANVTVQCSSVWDQWTNHAQPATLALNGTSLARLPAAQSSCASASRTIKRVAGALVAGAVVALVVSFLFRRVRRL